MTVRIFASVLAALCAACATSGGDARPTAPAASAGSPEASVTLGPVASPVLPAKSCGMILWTLDETRPAAIFRYVSGARAEMTIGGRAVSLARVDGEGAAAFGVFERQRFTDGAGLDVRVEARFSSGFDGGAYLERGLVAVEAQDGWRAVAPAAGIAGCRS